MNELSYGNKNLSDFGAFYDSHSSFGSPERDVELVEVAGKNGALIIDNDRYRNIELTFNCYIHKHFLGSYRSLLAYLQSLRGYNRLEISQEPNHFRMASFNMGSQPSPNQFHRSGQFPLVFNCKPQRYLKSGEETVEITANTTINNPTLFPSYPLIRIYGAGTVTINNQVITVSAHSLDYIDINCDLMDAYCGSTNANQYVSFSDNEYITLHSGANGIEIDDVTSIEITPNWYEI